MDLSSLSASLQAKGLRLTPQRLAIYQYLLEHPVHPSADTIYQAISRDNPSFSRTTIYNTLKTLCDAGLIQTITIEPYEQRFDGNPKCHGHFRCLGCGNVFDFPIDESVLDEFIPGSYDVETKSVYMTGYCDKCKRQKPKSEKEC